MLSAYDEDILENPFFITLQERYPELYNAAAANCWMICVPRIGTVKNDSYTLQEFQNYILIPAEQKDGLYKTASNKVVNIQGKSITTQDGFEEIKSVNILFEEVFYNDSDESYRVLCVDNPFQGSRVELNEPAAVFQSISTFEGCTELLWGHTGSTKTQRQLDKVIQTFNETCKTFEGRKLVNIVDVTHALFTKSMQVVLRDSYLKQIVKSKESYMDQIKLAIETYVLHHVYKRVFRLISACEAQMDAALNKKTRNLSELQLKDLGVRTDLRDNIPKAKKELLELNRYSTPLGKLNCVKRVITALMQPSRRSKDVTPLTTDDILPVLVFMVVKSEVPNWFANFTFMNQFRFSKTNNDDEFGFYAASLEAAIQHVHSGALNKFILGEASYQISSASVNQPKASSKQVTKTDLLFQYVKDGAEDKVEALLNKNKQDKELLKKQLCHPLCSCDVCEKVLAESRENEASVTAFSRDDRGLTALHVAAVYGNDCMLQTLIKMGGVVNAADYHGMTPLHLASQKGKQNITLMLLHYKANPNQTDNDGNTPLHLCTANGHEECVKALLYYDVGFLANLVEVNKCNDYGDTPLHMAAKWGYENIIRELLGHGASVEARNRKKQTPLHSSHNAIVSQFLMKAANRANNERNFVKRDLPHKVKNQEVAKHTPTVTIPRKLRTESDLTTSPKIIETEEMKKIEKLLKAVHVGDIELVKFQLGWSGESSDEDDSIEMSERVLCHPLCQCPKCMPLQKKITSPGGVSVNTMDAKGIFPLYEASLNGHSRLTELLIKHGANVNAKTDVDEDTAVHVACQHNKPQVVKVLLDHGAKVNIKDIRGNTPLHIGCMKGAERCAMRLLKKEANINVQNLKGNSPLHEASWWNFINMVELLLKHGAWVNCKNRQQLTPLQLSQGQDVSEMLEEASSKLNGDEVDDSLTGRTRSMAISEGERKPSLLHFSRPSVYNIFAAFEEEDLDRIHNINASIQAFNKQSGLHHVETYDKSVARFDSHLKHNLAIKHFDPHTLRHIETKDNSSSLDTKEENQDVNEDTSNSFKVQYTAKDKEALENLENSDTESCDES